MKKFRQKFLKKISSILEVLLKNYRIRYFRIFQIHIYKVYSRNKIKTISSILKKNIPICIKKIRNFLNNYTVMYNL